MLRERILPKPEVIRAIVLEYSQCGGVPAPVRSISTTPTIGESTIRSLRNAC